MENQSDFDNREKILKVYNKLGIIDTEDKGIIKMIYSLSSGTIHFGRTLYSCEVFIFKNYVEYLEEKLTKNIRSYGVGKLADELDEELKWLLLKKEPILKELFKWLKKFPLLKQSPICQKGIRANKKRGIK